MTSVTSPVQVNCSSQVRGAQHLLLRQSVWALQNSLSELSGKCCCASALQNEVSGILVTSVKSLVRVNCPLQVPGDSMPVGECPDKFPSSCDRSTLHFLVFVFLASRSRYAENDDEFEELQRPFLFEGEPSLDTSMGNTFPGNFSDVNSDDMSIPVPEWLNQLEMEEDFEYPNPEEYEPSLQEDIVSSEYNAAFGPEDALNLRRVMGDMCAATPPVLTVTMPWELPGISLVIGEDEPIVPTPILYPVQVVDEEVPHSNPSHRVARVEHIRGSYHEVIDFKLTLEESEITASRCDRALEKWYLIFARGRSGWPRGHDIDTLVAQRGVAGLRTILGNRSHNTVLKRAN